MKVLLVNSGGLDSAIVAKWLHSQGYEVYSVFFSHRQEALEASLKAAKETAKRYCIDHHIITVDMGYETNYKREGMDGVLANLSLALLSLAISYGHHLGVEEVYSGTKGHVPANYADEYNHLIEINTRLHVPKLITPLAPLDARYDIMAEGLGVDISDLQYTHSCTHNEPCGICSKCEYRNKLWQ